MYLVFFTNSHKALLKCSPSDSRPGGTSGKTRWASMLHGSRTINIPDEYFSCLRIWPQHQILLKTIKYSIVFAKPVKTNIKLLFL